MKNLTNTNSSVEPQIIQEFEGMISPEHFNFVLQKVNQQYHDDWFVGVQEPEHDSIPSDDYSYVSKEYDITLKKSEEEIALVFKVGHSATKTGSTGDGYFSPHEDLISTSFNLEEFHIYIDGELAELSEEQSAFLAKAIVENYIP